MTLLRQHGLLLLGLISAGVYALWPPAIDMVAMKVAGVALFALYAATNARSRDGWLITIVMAFGALGDVLIEWRMEAGATAFAIGHVIAIWLYAHNRSPDAGQRRPFSIALIPISIAIAAMVAPAADKLPVMAYAVFVSAMAASALNSRFPAGLTGLGALMFLTSDLLIFARMGPLAGIGWVTPTIWALYVAGQALIVFGVTRTLGRERAP